MYSDTAQKKLVLRTSTASPGFSVRQSEETIKILRKENFNLKLKMYLMEKKLESSSRGSEMEKTTDQEFFELFRENELLKIELNDHQNLLKESLEAVRKVEEQRTKYQMKYEDLFIDKQAQTRGTPKAVVKSPYSKKSKKNLALASTDKYESAPKTLRIENKRLKIEIASLKLEINKDQQTIDKLSSEMRTLQNLLDLKESKLIDVEAELVKFKDMLIQQDSTSSINELPLNTVDEISMKNLKLEQVLDDQDRLLNEQSKLMKALNRTIEAKNEELIDYKNRLSLRRDLSDSSESYIPKTITLRGNSLSTSSFESSEFPFYNPLFGLEYESMYR